VHTVGPPRMQLPQRCEQKMDFDVNAYRDAQGRWHHQILGPLPLQSADAPVFEECHNAKAGTRCIGFTDFASAVNVGWQRVRVLLNQSESKPQKAAPPADGIRTKL
jgi:hypothetical protein